MSDFYHVPFDDVGEAAVVWILHDGEKKFLGRGEDLAGRELVTFAT